MRLNLSVVISGNQDDLPRRIVLPGDVPSPIHPRCPIAEERCKTEVPVFREVAKDHFAVCHLAGTKIDARK
jgi:ABC-type antimicrobial peptide transport system ATPase subunit